MGRPLRPTDDDLVYHAINRGNNRDVLFDDDKDPSPITTAGLVKD